MEISGFFKFGLGVAVCGAMIAAPLAESYAGSRQHWRGGHSGYSPTYSRTFIGYGSRYGYSSRYGSRYGYRGYKRHGHGNDAALLVLGLGLGYVISEGIRSANNRAANTRYDPPVDRRWTSNTSQTQSYGMNDYDQVCLEAKTYEQVIRIDGEEFLAEGTACLQPDGSWDLQGINLPN